MSLKVWLPLTGDLNNYGTQSLPNTSVNSFTYGAGKIGQCASGRVAWILPEEILDNAWSVAMWVRPESLGSNNNILFCKNGTAATDCQIYFSIISTTQLNIGVNGPSSSVTATGQTFTLNKWYHVAATYDGQTASVYLNGQLLKSGTVTTEKPTGRLNMNINGRCTNVSNTGSTGHFTGAFNDFRLYNHCLSLSEVREIAQGLILHYKLDGNVGLGNPNLLINSLVPTEGNGASGITKSITDDGIQKVTAASSNGNWVTFGNHNTTLALTKGDTFTFSLMIKSDDSVKKPTVYFQSGLGYYGMQGTMSNEWSIIYYTGTWSIDNLNTNLHLGFSSAPGTYYIKYFKLEKGAQYTPWAPAAGEPLSNLNYIQDSSGYNHNGEIISELHVSNDSARYKNSTLFDGIDDCIIVPYNTICPENIFTINLWFKKDALGSKNYETLFGGPGGFEMDTRAGSATSLSLYMASTRSGNRATGITMNEWHMITMTRDGTAEKYYVDGEFKSEIEAKPMPNGVYRIGAWASNTGQNYYGLISDFRIYATPLLDSDIKKLYNTSMSVDRANQLHTFELEEIDDVKTLQQGILTGNIVEPFVTLDDGSHWQLLMYHYVDKGNNLFTQSTALDCNEFGLFSRLAYVNNFVYDGKYEFYVIQDDIEYRWTQTNQPTATSPRGFTAVSGYTNPVNGLVKAGSNSYFGYNSWWGACGCWTKYSTGGKTGIPGFGAHNAAGICERYLALYARIDEPHGKISYDKFNQFTQFIER